MLYCIAVTPRSLSLSKSLSKALLGVLAFLFFTLSFPFTYQFSRLFSSIWYVQTGTLLFSASSFWLLWHWCPLRKDSAVEIHRKAPLQCSHFCHQTGVHLKNDKGRGKRQSSDVTGGSGREESRKAKCVAWETGQWKVVIGTWQQLLGRWYACCTDSMLSFGRCSQDSDGLCTGMQAIDRILRDQYTCMKYWLGAFLCVPYCLALSSCSAGSSTLLFASSSQSSESGPFSWGHTVVFFISYGPQWFCPLSHTVFEVVQSNTCIWNQWRKKGDKSVGKNRVGLGKGI